MPHARWIGAFFMVTLWGVAPAGADAQVVSFVAHTEWDTFIDVSYTANGRSVRCTPDNILGGPHVAETIVDSVVGSEDVATQRFFCGDVAIDLYRELRVEEVRIEGNRMTPSWAYFRAKVDVVFDGGAGDSVNVYDVETTLVFAEGRGNWVFLRELQNVPGVVFHNLVDAFTTRFEL